MPVVTQQGISFDDLFRELPQAKIPTPEIFEVEELLGRVPHALAKPIQRILDRWVDSTIGQAQAAVAAKVPEPPAEGKGDAPKDDGSTPTN